MPNLTKDEALRHLGGTAEDVARGLTEYTDAAKVLSSNHPRLIDEHPHQWVGVHRGRIVARGKSLKSLMAQLESAGIPPEKTIVRFIDKEERTLIL